MTPTEGAALYTAQQRLPATVPPPATSEKLPWWGWAIAAGAVIVILREGLSSPKKA